MWETTNLRKLTKYLFDSEDECLKFCTPSINFDEEEVANETSNIKIMPRKGASHKLCNYLEQKRMSLKKKLQSNIVYVH